MRTKKYALQGTYPCEKRGKGPLYFALFTKDEIEKSHPRLAYRINTTVTPPPMFAD